MKKVAVWGSLILALMACSRFDEQEIFETKELVFTATREESDTKTVRVGTDVLWSPGDAISIFFRSGDNGGSKFTAQNTTENVAIAQFKGTIDVLSGGGESEDGEFWFWGIYPYSSQNSCDGSSITTVIPTQQTGKAGTFADNTFITMARSKGLNLAFYNICSGVKFTLTRDDIKEVKIRGNNGEDIAGKIKAVWDANGKPAITEYIEGAKEVSVTAPGSGTFATGTEYYLVLAPTLFTGGFTMSIKTSDDKLGMFVYENSRQFSRGIFINISDLDTRVTSWIDVAAKAVPEEGGEVTLEFFSNVLCHAVIPEDAQSWISVAPETKAVTQQSIGLIIQPNTGLSRSATINVVADDDESNVVLSYIVTQEPNHEAQLAIEREALIDLYQCGNGDNWLSDGNDYSNWCTDAPVSEWGGVHLDGDGFVFQILIRNYDGSIPSSIGSFYHLDYLEVEGSFHGSIPIEIGRLHNMRFLMLVGNTWNGQSGLTGDIPDVIYDLKKLETINLSLNALTGGISNKIGQLDHLVQLNLESNNLSGSLPSELSYCQNLVSVDLLFNYFSGDIPREIMNCEFWRNCWGHIIPRGGKVASLFGGHNNNFDNTWDDLVIPAPRFPSSAFGSLYYTDGEEVLTDDIYNAHRLTILYDWRENDGYWPEMNKIYDYFHNKGLEIIGFCPQWDSLEETQILWRNTYMQFWYPDRQNTQIDGVFVNNINVVNSDGLLVWSNYMSPVVELIPFLNVYLDGDMESAYLSTDYSRDGNVSILQSSDISNGVDVIFMGDAFSDRQIEEGVYNNMVKRVIDALFSEEPFKSMKDYFNVYSVDVVSPSEGYELDGQKLGTVHGGGTYVYGNNSKVIEYAKKAISEERLDDALIIVMMNEDAYAGTCYMYSPPSGNYGRGLSIAYFPVSSDTDTFNGLVSHEAGGHGFAKLADEYAYEYMGAISDDEIASTRVNEPYGWWKNVDFTSDPVLVKWSQFLADDRYANEGLGCYEGGLTYWSGVWRPTDASIMRYNTGGFNAPSRYAIWYRIGKLAYGENWEGSYEDFVTYDAVNRTPAAIQRRNAQRRNYVEKPLPQLPAPVVVGHSWREELEKGR